MKTNMILKTVQIDETLLKFSLKIVLPHLILIMITLCVLVSATHKECQQISFASFIYLSVLLSGCLLLLMF